MAVSSTLYRVTVGDGAGRVSTPGVSSSVPVVLATWSLAETVPGGSAIGVVVMPPYDFSVPVRRTFHKVLGNPNPVPITDVIEARSGTMTLLTTTQTTFAQLLAFLHQDTTFFLVSPYGDVFYLRIQPSGPTPSLTQSSAQNQWRLTQVAFQEVAEPA